MQKRHADCGTESGRGRSRGVLESEDLQPYRQPRMTGKARDEEDYIYFAEIAVFSTVADLAEMRCSRMAHSLRCDTLTFVVWNIGASLRGDDLTCPCRPARVVVKFTSVMTDAASGGMSGFGFRVVRKRRKSSL